MATLNTLTDIKTSVDSAIMRYNINRLLFLIIINIIMIIMIIIINIIILIKDLHQKY